MSFGNPHRLPPPVTTVVVVVVVHEYDALALACTRMLRGPVMCSSGLDVLVFCRKRRKISVQNDSDNTTVCHTFAHVPTIHVRRSVCISTQRFPAAVVRLMEPCFVSHSIRRNAAKLDERTIKTHTHVVGCAATTLLLLCVFTCNSLSPIGCTQFVPPLRATSTPDTLGVDLSMGLLRVSHHGTCDFLHSSPRLLTTTADDDNDAKWGRRHWR